MAITTDGAISKDPNSSTNQTITTPTISGGTIDNTTIGGTTPAAGTFTALTVAQGAADTEVIDLQSTDVSHAVTDNFDANTFGSMIKTAATTGGLSVTGITDADASGALTLRGIIGAADPTDTNAAVVLTGAKLATNTYGAVADAETVAKIQNHTAELVRVLGSGAVYFSDADVAHGMTTFLPTTVYGELAPISGTVGGLRVRGYADGDAKGLYLEGASVNPAANAPINLTVFKQSGTGGAALGDTIPAVQVDNYSSTGIVIIMGNGDIKSLSQNITAGTGTGVTINSTGHINRQVYKVTTTYAAYADSDTKKGIVIATLPAKTKLVGAYADTTAAYTGGAVSAATLVVGVTAEDGAEIIAVHDVFAGAVTKGLADADMGTGMTRAAQIQGGYLPSWTGTTAVYATITTTTANTNALTAGSTTFYLVCERM